MNTSIAFHGGKCFLGILIGACVWANCALAGPNVLLLWDNENEEVAELPPAPDDPGLYVGTRDLIQALIAAGIQVTLSEVSQDKYLGFDPQPGDFDAVIHLNSNPSGKIMGSTGIMALESYVRNGGAYIGAENNASFLTIPSSMGGMDETIAWLTPLDISTETSPAGTSLTVQANPGAADHPFYQAYKTLNTLMTFDAKYTSSKLREYTAPVPETTVLYYYESLEEVTKGGKTSVTNPVVAVRTHEQGRVVGFNFAPNYDTSMFTLSWPAVQDLYINAVYWADQKAPTVTAIDVIDGPRIPGSDLVFTVHFSEGVTAVSEDDFSVVTTRSAVCDETVEVVPLGTDARTYQVTISNAQGEGAFQLKVADDDSIKDQSVNTNVLGGVGTGNGDFLSDSITIDVVAPDVIMHVAGGNLVPLGATPKLIFDFDEPMDISVYPTVTVHNEAGDAFQALPTTEGGDGVWITETQYRVSLDRAVSAEDEGVATVTISGAADVSGNAIVDTKTFYFGMIEAELRLLQDLEEGPVTILLGTAFSLTITAAGALGDIQYQWYRETESKAVIPVGDDSNQFTLAHVRLSDEGVYFCEVRDSIATIESNRVELIVELPKVPVSSGIILFLMASLVAGSGVMRLHPCKI